MYVNVTLNVCCCISIVIRAQQRVISGMCRVSHGSYWVLSASGTQMTYTLHRPCWYTADTMPSI